MAEPEPGSPPRRVAVDGFQLTLRQHTPAARHVLALCDALAEHGCALDGIFDAPIRRATPPVLREVLFFDALDRRRAPDALDRRRAECPRHLLSPGGLADAMAGMMGCRLLPVLPAGRVVEPAFAERLPRFGRVFARTDVVAMAWRHFARTGRLLPLRGADGAQVAHWMGALPVWLMGADNVFMVHDVGACEVAVLRAAAREGGRICAATQAGRARLLELLPQAPHGILTLGEASPLSCPTIHEAPRLLGLAPQAYFAVVPPPDGGPQLSEFLTAATAAGLSRPLVVLDRGTGARQTAVARHLPELREEVRAGVLQGARAVLYPWAGQSSALPVLEALALGRPVLVGAGAGAETAGEAGVSLETLGPEDAMRRLDTDDMLCDRLAAAAPRIAAARSTAFTRQLALLHAAVAEGRRPIAPPGRGYRAR